MNWRHWIGLTPTEADFACHLLSLAEEVGNSTWRYDAADSTLRSGEQVINLGNLYLEYSRAPRRARASFRDKYRAILAPPRAAQVTALWSVAQTNIYPLLRSRFERIAIDIQYRGKDPLPPRAAKPFLGKLDMAIGYDHGSTVTQVPASTVIEWGVTLDAALDRARANLRALAPPRWVSAGPTVWSLDSPGSYAESFLQFPKIFERLAVKGTPLAMIPNRGVLLATGTDESGGIAALLNAAKNSMQGAPWPLCADLFRITATGPELYDPDDPNTAVLATLQKIDLAGLYKEQKEALEKYHASIQDDVFVATYALMGKKHRPEEAQSWCAWTQGVHSLLPVTDFIAFVWDLDKPERKTALVPWVEAERLVGHYLKPTGEEPPRWRVDEFPTEVELSELREIANRAKVSDGSPTHTQS